MTISFVDGESLTLLPEQFTDELWKVGWALPAQPAGITLIAKQADWLVHGIAIVDNRDNSFRELVPGQYRAIYSGDVKIYQNIDLLPRAFWVGQWRWQPDTASAINGMRASAFDPHRMAMLTGQGEDSLPNSTELGGSGVITSYQPEQVTVQVESGRDGLLVLADAYYPGWVAELDGEQVEIVPANGMFRGVFVPAGSHQLQFNYQPLRFQLGRLISLFAFVIWLLCLFFVVRGQMRQDTV